MDKPLISVILPTYNRASLLKIALNSLILQTYKDWEAIVINNFSEDETIDVIDSFADNRIKLINFSNHGIIAASRNEGMRYASGEYIAFLDSDDIWYPEKLTVCLKYLEKNIDILCHNVKFRNEKGIIKNFYAGPKRDATFMRLLYKKNCFATSAMICRKSLIEKVDGFKTDKIYNTAEDYDLWLRLLKITNKVCFVDKFLGENLIHQGNESGNIKKHLAASLAVVKHHHMSNPRTILNCFRYNINRSIKIACAVLTMGKNKEYKSAVMLAFMAIASFFFIKADT